MTTPTSTSSKSSTRTHLVGVLLVLSTALIMLVSFGAVQIGRVNASAPAPVPVPQPPVTETVTVTPTPAPAPAPSTVTTTVQPPPVGDPPVNSAPELEPESNSGSYISDAEIRNDVSYAFTVADTYWKNLFASWAGTQQWWTPALYNGDGFYDSALGHHGPYCGNERVDDESAQFCEAGYGYSGYGEVSWDMDFFRGYSQYGDAAFYMVVAHEVGHAAQTRFLHDGETEAVLDNWEGQFELQADCIAGATLGKAEQDGLLTREPGDLNEMAQVSAHSGSYTDHSHGTPEQRAEYFQRGYQSADIEACLGNK